MRLFPNAKRAKEKLLKEFKGLSILDVGCGCNKTPGALGIDRRFTNESPPENQLDIKHDLTQFPWPVKDNTFDLVVCQHVIEHLPDTARTMKEFHRIARPGGKVFMETPHFSWFEAYRHYEHCHMFSFQSFDYFLKDNKHGHETDFSYSDKAIFFDDLAYCMGVGFLANMFPRLYEKRLAFIFPATSFYITLRVDKK